MEDTLRRRERHVERTAVPVVTSSAAGTLRDGPALDPGRFHFYQHIPPKPERCRATFDRVLPRFDGCKYRDPEWFGYKITLKVIQSARIECPMENPLLDKQVALFA